MHGIDERLEGAVRAFITRVHLREVRSVVSVIVIARSVLHHRGDPDGSEAEGFDVVKFLDEAFEVTAPEGVSCVHGVRVPSVGVVRGITIVETCGHGEINCLIAEVVAISHECSS